MNPKPEHGVGATRPLEVAAGPAPEAMPPLGSVARRLRALLAIAESATLEEAARGVVDDAVQLICDCEALICIVAPGAPHSFRVISGAGPWASTLVGQSLSFEGSLNAKALLSQSVFETHDAPADSVHRRLLEAGGIHSALLVPLRVPTPLPDGRIEMGVVSLMRRSSAGFSDAERSMAEEYGELVSTVLAQCELSRIQRETNLRLIRAADALHATRSRLHDAHERAISAVDGVSLLIGAGGSASEFFGKTSESVAALVDARRVFVTRVGPGERHRPQPHGFGFSDEELAGLGDSSCAPGEDRLSSRLIHGHQTWRGRLEDAVRGAGASPTLTRLGDDMMIACGWYSGGMPMGVLSALSSRRAGGFTDEDLWVLRICAGAAGLVWQHRQAQERLAASQVERRARLEEHAAEIRALIDGALDAFIAMDERGSITDLNPAAERILGFRRSDAVGRELATLIVPPELRERHRAGLERVLAGGASNLIGRLTELEAMCADGNRVPVELALSMVTVGGRPVFHGFLRDISIRHRAEELDREQGRRLTALEQAKTQLLNLASHELRGPIGILHGYLSMLEEEQLGGLPAPIAAVMPLLRGKVAEMNLLVDGMLEAARLEDDRLRLTLGPLDLREAVEQAVLSVTALTTDAERVRMAMPGELVIVRGDRSRLASVVGNLVHNALKYSPGGGSVDVRLTLDGGASAILEVSDHGIGIASSDIDQLFTRFGRIVTRDNSNIQGTGLGLYLARELARLHGGDITVSSTVGEGSVFTLVIPTSSVAAPAAD